jgi:hypothetical protein
MKLKRRRVVYVLVMSLLFLGLWHDGRIIPSSALYLIAPSGLILFCLHVVLAGMVASECAVRAIRFGTDFKAYSEAAKRRFGDSAIWLLVLLVYSIRIVAGESTTPLTWMVIVLALGVLFDDMASTVDALWSFLPQHKNET